MKKHIIAAAVAAAVAVPAMAQNVSLYGRLDTGYGSLDNKQTNAAQSAAISLAGMASSAATGSAKGIAYGIDQTAMWGFRGTEDLGGGLKASFVVESGIAGGNSSLPSAVVASANSASGQTFANATNLGSRLLFASLSNAGGTEVRVGYQSTFIRDVAVSYAADAATNVTGNAVALGFTPRANQVAIMQTSGAMMLGASYSVQSTNAGGVRDTDIGTGYQLTARYSAGAFSAQGTYAKNTNGVQDAATKRDATTMIAGASYDFGAAQAFAQYADYENVTGPSNNDPSARVWNVGVRLPVGNLGLFAGYSAGDNRAAAGGYVGDVSGYNVGARYALSKRTNAYGIMGRLTIDTSATADQSLKMWGVGVTHLF